MYIKTLDSFFGYIWSYKTIVVVVVLLTSYILYQYDEIVAHVFSLYILTRFTLEYCINFIIVS